MTGEIVLGFDGSARDTTSLVAMRQDDAGGWQIHGWAHGDGIMAYAAPGTSEPDQPVREHTPGGLVLQRDIPLDQLPPWLDTGFTLIADQARQISPPSAASGDILDLIDATVDAVAQPAPQPVVQTCGCGCGRHVTGDSPSLDFATFTCQQRWHNEQALNPGQVYQRGDAAEVFVGADDADVPLIEPPAGPGPANPYGAAYRRACGGCGERVIPVVLREHGEQIHQYDDDDRDIVPIRVAEPTARLECPHCGETLPGTAFTGTATEHGGVVVLELSDDQSRVRRTIPVSALQTGTAPRLLQRMWEDMEHALTRFRARFNGHRTSTGRSQ